MKRNENKEFQSQVIFSPKLSSLSLQMKVVTKLGLKTSFAVKTLRQHLLVSIDSTDAHRSINLPLVDLYVVSLGEMSFKLQNAPKS
ncbi:hypothetical protein IGI04_006351 [Brassica rapa subsp. trilocularis]|uniref:Uncharacterized protein n=1 Tax=Brassica rapa subsp. trilocularis TaxID=1813537 RepID=A0ABQ7NGN5_BRACM|nr:hypothetical protein IGI04_006351 [Brassica rapa subsp. trilocularis]